MAAKKRIRVIPLGGVGEVGKNATLVEYGTDMVLIDAGVMFPEEELLGVDLVIPDFAYLLEHVDHLRGIIITHGHEDHVGALPYLLQQVGRTVPVYGARLTLGLARLKLREHQVLERAELHEVKTGSTVALGQIEVGFFSMNHSVPDALALTIKTPIGTIVHTSDFKLAVEADGSGPAGLDDLRRVAAKGTLALLSDCVRIEQPGRTPPESVVGETLDRLIKEAKGRVIITTFASNITRLRQAIHSAARHGRKVAVAGRSLEGNLKVAGELGYLEAPPGTILPLADTRHLPAHQVLLLTTGSQGEPTSVLARIAVGDHRQIRIQPGDTVIMAASPVPGNEETFSRTIDNLFRQGANVIYKALVDTVHVSGHASREELREMIEITRPDVAVPMHGEYRHMVLYRDLALETGIPPERILLPDVGDVLEFAPGMGRKNGRVASGSVLVDGLNVGGVSSVVLRDRRRLAGDGVLIASLAVDRETGELLAGPDLMARGFVHPMDGDLEQQAKAQVQHALQRRPRGHAQIGFLMGKTREVLGEFIYRQTRQRPLILPVITEL